MMVFPRSKKGIKGYVFLGKGERIKDWSSNIWSTLECEEDDYYRKINVEVDGSRRR